MGGRDDEKGGGTVRGRECAADADGGDNVSSETRVSSLRGNLIGSTHVAELGSGDVTVRRATRRGYEAISSARPVWRSSAQGDVTVRRATMRRAARYGCETMVQARLVFLHSARGNVTTRRAARCGCDTVFLRTRVWSLGSGGRDDEHGGGTVRRRENAADADGGVDDSAGVKREADVGGG